MSAADKATEKATQAGERAQHSQLLRVSVTTGLLVYGAVHLLIGWIAAQLAWGGSSEEASQQGALQELAEKPFGGVLLWTVASGMFVLVLWQGLEALVGQRDKHGAARVLKRLSSVGRAAVYLALAVSAAGTAAGSSSGGNEETLTARMLAAPAGRVLVAAVGVGILAVGIHHLYKAATADFTDDLTPGIPPTTVTLGRVGYAAKGLAFGIVGVLFGWAALTYDPDKAGGLDAALRTLRDQPAGPVPLTLTALGIACFGVYCFIWARNARH